MRHKHWVRFNSTHWASWDMPLWAPVCQQWVSQEEFSSDSVSNHALYTDRWDSCSVRHMRIPPLKYEQWRCTILKWSSKVMWKTPSSPAFSVTFIYLLVQWSGQQDQTKWIFFFLNVFLFLTVADTFLLKWNFWEICCVGLRWHSEPTPIVMYQYVWVTAKWSLLKVHRCSLDKKVLTLQFNFSHTVTFYNNCSTLFHQATVTWLISCTSGLNFLS